MPVSPCGAMKVWERKCSRNFTKMYSDYTHIT